MMILRIAILLSLYGCNSEPEIDFITKKYVYDFYNMKFAIANNLNANTPKEVLPLIDSIIAQVKLSKISSNLRTTVVQELEKMIKAKAASNQEDYDELMAIKHDFEIGNTNFLEDLNVIDKFLHKIYWQYWQCNMGVGGVETLLSFDTIMLSTNKEYEIPIRIEYNGLPTSTSIIANTMQGSQPNRIKFRTEDGSSRYQIITYKCEAINEVTREVQVYDNTIVVELVKPSR